MFTCAPGGMPGAQADTSALPRVIFTRVMISLTATSSSPLQLPTHGSAGCVAVGVAVTIRLGVLVGAGGVVRVGVPVAVALDSGVLVGVEIGVSVFVAVAVGSGVKVGVCAGVGVGT